MRVYDVIKTAEDTYISETSRLIYPGMCWCLKVSAVKGFDFKEKNRKGITQSYLIIKTYNYV